MSAWRTDDPPKGKTILADIGYPWPVVAVWNGYCEEWAWANVQVNMVDGEWNDHYFETEYEKETGIKRWMPLPELS